MNAAVDDLKLDRLIVLYLGDKAYPLAEGVEVIPLTSLPQPETFSQAV
jgi:hypothetical protein